MCVFVRGLLNVFVCLVCDVLCDVVLCVCLCVYCRVCYFVYVFVCVVCGLLCDVVWIAVVIGELAVFVRLSCVFCLWLFV